MRISAVKAGVVGTPWRNLTVVEGLDRRGSTGVGEARMLNHTDALDGYLGEAVPKHVGSDPFEIETLKALELVVDGAFDLPSGVGLGVTLDWDAVEAHPRRDLHFDLFADGWHRRHAEVGS